MRAWPPVSLFFATRATPNGRAFIINGECQEKGSLRASCRNALRDSGKGQGVGGVSQVPHVPETLLSERVAGHPPSIYPGATNLSQDCFRKTHHSGKIGQGADISLQ